MTIKWSFSYNFIVKLMLFNKGILQRNYKKMTIKWSFSYIFFVKFSLYNMIHLNTIHFYGPQI